MATPTKSYNRVFYDLRPAKQIERRMLIDTLQRLMAGGFPIRDYQYTGMGSIYFVDFVLFYKLLGMQRMLSVEHDRSIRKRVEFNKPYRHVEIEMASIGEVIPKLDRDIRHLLWLDYDFRLNSMVVSDAALAAYHLSPGSILLVTVDVKPPHGTEPRHWHAHYQEQAGRFFAFDWDVSNFALSELPDTNAQILFNAIHNGLAARPHTRFLPLFKFLYADGHPMITIGGMIGTGTDARSLDACDFTGANYIRRDTNASLYEIDVPRLTRKERQYMDRYMPCLPEWKPKDFELESGEIAAYSEIYQYYPAYAELLL